MPRQRHQPRLQAVDADDCRADDCGAMAGWDSPRVSEETWLGMEVLNVNIWLWTNTYENTIFSGMNIHKSQLF